MNKHSFLGLAVGFVLLFPLLTGCAHNYPNPNSVVLQEPAPGQALIYFLRAPYDNVAIDILSKGKRIVKMPIDTYVALPLPPGRYQFITTSSSMFGSGNQIAEKLEVELRPDQRVFYHVSGDDDKQISVLAVMSSAGGVVPLLVDKGIVKNRVWKECSELDARGLITISRQVQPDTLLVEQ